MGDFLITSYAVTNMLSSLGSFQVTISKHALLAVILIAVISGMSAAILRFFKKGDGWFEERFSEKFEASLGWGVFTFSLVMVITFFSFGIFALILYSIS